MDDRIIDLKERAITGLKFNPKLWLSIGESRFSTSWKNKQMSWAEFLARLKSVTVTQETHAEYMKLSKPKQDAIKDVGGFVGGTLKEGRRKADTVVLRSMLTFDLDFAPDGFVENLTLEAPYAWCIYSTHKHTPDKPRYRLIAPLKRDVSPEEYKAIMRKMAEEIGMKYFDSTTFQPSRLMYWPSCSRDSEYVFDYNDDAPLDPDEILAKYPDWRDVSYWPVSPDEIRVQKKKADKAQDPTKKSGPVGTFCRTYTVPEAIETFLADTYTPTDRSDRYTYAHGSTHGGLVIYDDGLFCYSNHATDPAHGMDLNAFDLVRVHLFGHDDDDTPEGTPVTRLPSYRAMTDLIRTDERCIEAYDAERRAAALEDFDEAAEPDDSWRKKLTRTKSMEVEKTIANLTLVMDNDPKLRSLKYNELSRHIEYDTLPWRDRPGEWCNDDDGELYIYLALQYCNFKKADTQDALASAAHKRGYHPIKRYLEALPAWDKVPRCDRLFVDYLGAIDEPYTREATRKWLLAAIRRVYEPGCKFDYVPVLSGPPGIGKSTLAARLGGAWFSDSLTFEDMRDKTAAEKLQGVWIMEIGELKGMRKMDFESVKSFLSRQIDRYRPSYGRVVENHPRTCVCIGTSNADDYLRDLTGNRRFWPIPVTGDTELKPWDITDEDVAQIWAEIYAAYKGGERTVTLTAEAEATAQKRQQEAMEMDERTGLVEVYLQRKLPEGWADMPLEDRRFWLSEGKDDGTVERTSVTVMEVWAECFKRRPEEKKRADSDDIARMLKRLGWEQKGSTRSKLYGKQKVYISGTSYGTRG